MGEVKNISEPGARCAKISIIQLEVAQGHPALNAANMLDAIESARRAGAEVIVFPELAVCGAGLGRRWNSESFLRECEDCGEKIRRASFGAVVVFGNVAVDWTRRNNDGSARKYNALFVAVNGCFAAPVNGPYSFVIKSCLPSDGLRSDVGVFHDIASLASEQGCTVDHLVSPVVAGDLSLGCMLCGGSSPDSLAFNIAALCRHPVNLFVAASCSPFLLDCRRRTVDLLALHIKPICKPFVFVNSAGVFDEGKIVRVLDGCSCAYDASGKLVARLAMFRHDVGTLEIPLSGAAGKGIAVEEENERSMLICKALLFGMATFTKKLGISRLVVGVSGGIDSAVIAAMCCRMLGRENVLLVNMPGMFVSPSGLVLARELAANLGCFYAEISIDPSVELTKSQVDGLDIAMMDGSMKKRLVLSEFMLENVQARDRSSRVLAALASAFGGAFTCNANKSEATVGYTTMYGDLGGYLAPIADLWKGDVYDLARCINKTLFGREVIPAGSFDRVPSAELSPQQNADEGKGDPLLYPYHDRLFESWVEWPDPVTPEEILEWYIAGDLEDKIKYKGNVKSIFADGRAFVEDLERWWALFQGMGAAKRIQAPPLIAVKERPLASLTGEPQMGAWFSQRYEELKKRVLW